jgi:hypothetical protein
MDAQLITLISVLRISEERVPSKHVITWESAKTVWISGRIIKLIMPQKMVVVKNLSNNAIIWGLAILK